MAKRSDTLETVLLAVELLRRIPRGRKVTASELHQQLKHAGMERDPRRYVLDWVFCSRRCQDAFHGLYGNWQRAKEGRIDKTEVAMIDPSDVELAAMRQCLKAFGEAGKPWCAW
ncbi:hypothetical protein AVS7_01759 [Acidovorax sp. MR-S7]|nr:hypothetical protein AVS7_01759 [Acidovorax sp. MR-S7]